MAEAVSSNRHQVVFGVEAKEAEVRLCELEQLGRIAVGARLVDPACVGNNEMELTSQSYDF
jgi:hypothetical protein